MSDDLPHQDTKGDQHALDKTVLIGQVETTEETAKNLSKPLDLFLTNYTQWLTREKDSKTPLHVDEIASRVAKLYELIRKVVDWKDDNVLRRNAIERIFKRILFGKLSGIGKSINSSPEQMAQTITIELIRGGHLPNDSVPQEVLPEIAQCIKKYLRFIETHTFSKTDPAGIKKRHNFQTFILELAACEIEELLTEPIQQYGLINSMTESLLARIKISPKDSISEDDKYIQVYIATCRTIFDLDDAFIVYRLLCFQYGYWKGANDQQIEDLNAQILSLRDQSETLLNHPQSRKFYAICEDFDTVFVLIGDILAEYSDRPNEIIHLFRHEHKLLESIEKHYDKRFASLKKRLILLGVFSTLSVFLSNWVTFFLIEVPMANIFYEGFNFFTAAIDFLVPTFIMFLLVIIIRPPSAANKKYLITEVKEFVYAQKPTRFYEIKTSGTKRPIVRSILGAIYLVIATAMTFGVGWVFYIFGLPITSVVFDTLTMSMTVFAAVTIRNKSKELTVGEKTSPMDFFMDIISLPFAKLGSFLAHKWKEYNIVAFLFTFIIETPFAIIIDLIEQWSNFLKEKRAELR